MCSRACCFWGVQVPGANALVDVPYEAYQEKFSECCFATRPAEIGAAPRPRSPEAVRSLEGPCATFCGSLSLGAPACAAHTLALPRS